MVEIEVIKQKVADADKSLALLEEKVNALVATHEMYAQNRNLAYIIAASQMDIHIPMFEGNAIKILPEQIQDDDSFTKAIEIDDTELRVINIRGYVLNAPQSQEQIRSTTTGNPVVYVSLVDETGEMFLSCYEENPMTFLVDEHISFLSPASLQQVLIKINKDGRRFLNITDNTTISFGSVSVPFPLTEIHHVPLAEIEQQYSTVMAVLTAKEVTEYVGCPECRKGGFDVESGEAVYCPTCSATRTIQTLSIENVFLMDSSGSLQCGLNRFDPINLSEFEVGMMVIATIRRWEKADGSEGFTILKMQDISPEAYLDKNVFSSTTGSVETYVPTEEDYEALEHLFLFESELQDADDQYIDQVLSVYGDICEFYNEITPRDLRRLMNLRLQGDEKKIAPAMKKALELGIIKFNRSSGTISPL